MEKGRNRGTGRGRRSKQGHVSGLRSRLSRSEGRGSIVSISGGPESEDNSDEQVEVQVEVGK